MTKTWTQIRQQYNHGDCLDATVVQHEVFGVFVTYKELENVKGLIRIVNFSDTSYGAALRYPPLGATIRGVIVDFSDEGQEISISIKQSHVEQYKATDKGITPYGSWGNGVAPW